MYEVGTYSVHPIYKLEKGAKGPMIFFGGGEGGRGHQVSMLIEIAKIQFIGTKEVKSFNKPCGHEPYWRLCYY